MILWSWPIRLNYCQEITVEEAKQCQKIPVGPGIQRLQYIIKSFGLLNQISKSFCQIGGPMCGEELEKVLKPPVSHQLQEEVLLLRGAFDNCKTGICTKWIRSAITVYSSITWSHLERVLWFKDLYSCKTMIQRRLCQRYIES